MPALLLAQQPQATRTRFVLDRMATVNVSQLPDDPWMTVLEPAGAEDEFNNPDMLFLSQQKQKASQLYPRRTLHTAQEKSGESLNIPVLNFGFDANTANGSVPLDNYLAISDSHKIASVSNTKFSVYDDAGTSIMTKSLSQFCQSLSLGGLNNHKYDPKVVYDPTADRFITVILNGSAPAYSKVIVGFSQTNDPEGVWNLYTVPGNPFNDTTWFDYPSIAVKESEIFITGNQIIPNTSWQLGFKQTVIWQIRKKEGYEGNPIVTDVWSNIQYGGRKIRNLHPVKGGSTVYGPKQYFLSNRNFDIQNDTIFLLEINDTLNAPGLQLNVNIIEADHNYGVPPNVPQMGSGQVLATNDGRVLAGIYENGEIQFASNCMDTSNGRSAIYFGVIDGVDAGSYTITTTLIRNDTLEFGYPNISWVGDGTQGSQSIVSFEHCSEYRKAGMSALFYADGQFSDIITVKEGLGAFNALSDSVERWGDYSGSQPVFNRNGKIWICGTYATASNAYQTWIAQLDNPFGAETGVNDPVPVTPQSLLFPNPASASTSLRFYLEHTLADLSIAVLDMQGRRLGIVYTGEALEGWNQLSFQTGHLASGTYFIQLMHGDNLLQTLKFVKD